MDRVIVIWIIMDLTVPILALLNVIREVTRFTWGECRCNDPDNVAGPHCEYTRDYCNDPTVPLDMRTGM